LKEQINERLVSTQDTLEKEDIKIETDSLPFGGYIFADEDLKEKETDDLLRIQTVQLHKLLQKVESNEEIIKQFMKDTKKFQKMNINYINSILNNILFWFVLTLISLGIGLIYFVLIISG